MSMSNNLCPVPFDQQPLNEFYALKKKGLFSFFGFRLYQYIYSLLNTCLVLTILCIPLILSSINFSWNSFLLHESFCVTLLLNLVLVRLYLGWSYIISRLFSSTVFYEESGWYDGQIWIKTSEMLTKDRLIGTYYVLPLLKRIKLTLIILTVCLLFVLFCLSLLS